MTTASDEIDAIIAKVADWRGPMLAHMRRLILEAEPEIVEEVKWRKPTNPDGVPVWSKGGIICTGETYKGKVKLTFAKGAKLETPSAGKRLPANASRREEPSSAGRRPAKQSRSTSRIHSVTELRANPALLFNGSIGGNTMRAIDISEGMEVDADAFQALVRAAIAFNVAQSAGR